MRTVTYRLVQPIQEFGCVKSLRKILNTQSFKCSQEQKKITKNKTLTVYVTTIAYMARLPVTLQGLQIYIWAVSRCGALLCENVSSWFTRISSNKKSWVLTVDIPKENFEA